MTDLSRSDRTIEIFTEALARDTSERSAFLDEACGDDADLRQAVERLLEAHGAAGRFLETPAVEFGGDAVREAAAETDLGGRTVGAYRLVERIGGGGMGSVYLAERSDSAFEKRVAIKVVHPGTGTSEILRRFDNERQVLASLEHPNISRLIDGGVTDDGVPYIVMEHVEGVALDRYCREHDLSIEDRLRLFRSVCEAVHYAHQRLVVHRDLKPGNILVTGEGMVKLLDFGISKMLDTARGPDLTRTEMRVMTPRYASPEQVRGQQITTASDVYALGILLYELLTGFHPFAGPDTTPRTIERAICEIDPETPSARARTGDASGIGLASDTRGSTWNPDRISRRLRGDLDTIVLMALRKEPNRRYRSAEALGEDIRRHLAGEPVIARAETLRYIAGKFVRRHAVSVGVVIALLVTLSVAAIVSTALYLRANAAQQEAERQRASAEEIATFLGEMLGSIHPETAQGRDATLLVEILEGASGRIDTELASDARAAASLHQTMGTTYRALARYAEAERHLTRAVALRRQERIDAVPGAGSRLASALLELGLVRFDVNREAEAKPLIEESLSLARLEHDRELVASAADALALSLTPLGEIATADSLYRNALEVRRELLAEAPDDTSRMAGAAGALVHLGGFLIYYGVRPQDERRLEAEVLLREALDVARMSGNGVVLSNALDDLADLLKRQGRYAEAEPLGVEAVTLGLELYGDRHPTYAAGLDNLAALYEFEGELERAEPLYRRALDIQMDVFGPQHSAVGTTLNNLGGLYRKMDRHAEADSCLARAVEIYRVTLGPEHAWVAIAMSNHARALVNGGSLGRGERVSREALRLTLLSMPTETLRIANVEITLGRCLLERRRYEEAETALGAALERLSPIHSDEHVSVQDALGLLARLYEETGRPARRAALEARLAAPSPDSDGASR